MPKASEIARSRVTAADWSKWLAGILGFLGAMLCACVAVILAPVHWGFFTLLAVGVAAVVLPMAIALRAMRSGSAEFKTAWLALLAVALLAWVAVGGWIKRTVGMEMALREVVASDRAANLRMWAMDKGDRPAAARPPEAVDSRNAFAIAGNRFRQFDARRVEHYRRYLQALDDVDWEAMSDPWTTGPASEHKAKEARFQAGFDALDAWYAAEVDSLKTLRADLAALALPAAQAQQFEGRVARLERQLRTQGYSERLLLDRAHQVAITLDTVRWSHDADAIRFRSREDSLAYGEAQTLLDRAINNREYVRRQLHGGVGR